VTALAARGLSVDVPPGWDAQIRAGGAGAGMAWSASDEGDAVAPTGSVLHAASFALPRERGDYGSGAVEVMRGSDVLVCLLEHEPEAVAEPLFRRRGLPRLTPAMFSPESMQRAIAGMSGVQRFFQVNGRPFCLYVVVGSHHTRAPLVRAADEVVQSIEIAA
jgi:hypothetical protein